MHRLLGYLLMIGEPMFLAVSASGAFNAVAVRGTPVALVIVARLASTAVCAAAGRAVLDGRPVGRSLASLGLALSCAVQVFAVLTPFFPSNRPPGFGPLYVAALVLYYGGWLLYARRSRRLAAAD